VRPFYLQHPFSLKQVSWITFPDNYTESTLKCPPIFWYFIKSRTYNQFTFFSQKIELTTSYFTINVFILRIRKQRLEASENQFIYHFTRSRRLKRMNTNRNNQNYLNYWKKIPTILFITKTHLYQLYYWL